MLLAPEVILWPIIMSMYSLLIKDHRVDTDLILKIFLSIFFLLHIRILSNWFSLQDLLFSLVLNKSTLLDKTFLDVEPLSQKFALSWIHLLVVYVFCCAWCNWCHLYVQTALFVTLLSSEDFSLILQSTKLICLSKDKDNMKCVWHTNPLKSCSAEKTPLNF